MQEAKLEPTERFVVVDIIAFMETPKSRLSNVWKRNMALYSTQQT